MPDSLSTVCRHCSFPVALWRTSIVKITVLVTSGFRALAQPALAHSAISSKDATVDFIKGFPCQIGQRRSQWASSAIANRPSVATART